MDNEDNPALNCTTTQVHNSGNSLLNYLLEDIPTGRDIFHSCPIVLKQPLQEQEDNLRFDLRSIEKQEFNRTFPEKPFPELLVEDVLEINIGFRRFLIDSIPCQKKTAQMNKTTYLKQSRQDKLLRYLQKKARRVWYRKVSYECRKVVADRRQRRNGRFVKKEKGGVEKHTREDHQPKIQINVKKQNFQLKVEEYYN